MDACPGAFASDITEVGFPLKKQMPGDWTNNGRGISSIRGKLGRLRGVCAE